MLEKIFHSKKVLLYIMAIAMMFSFSAWMSLLNNFVIEVASFDGSQIGILQSLREIPISTPVKAAFSTTKLLSNTIQTEKTNGIIKAIVSNKLSGF